MKNQWKNKLATSEKKIRHKLVFIKQLRNASKRKNKKEN